MKVIIVSTYPNYAEQKLYIQWGVESPPLTDIEFSVFRSESPSGGFIQIASNIYNAYFYVDDFKGTPGILSTERPFYYKVSARSGSEVAESNPVYFDGCISVDMTEQRDVDASYRTTNKNQYDKQLRLARNKLVKDLALGLDKVFGISAVLLKRKHWGARCGKCYDPIANKQIKTHCKQCYDTTWVGGYIPTNILVHEQHSMPTQVGSDVAGLVEVKQTSFVTLYFPKISYKDILVIKYNNTRYAIKSVNETYIRTIPIHQTIAVDLIPPEHVIYNFPIDTAEGAYVK